MTRVILTERFRNDLVVRVHSKRILSVIRSSVKCLETMPTAGSSSLPESIIEAFGDNVRKLSAPPFLIIYEYDSGDESVVVYALIHERQAY